MKLFMLPLYGAFFGSAITRFILGAVSPYRIRLTLGRGVDNGRSMKEEYVASHRKSSEEIADDDTDVDTDDVGLIEV